MTSTVLVADDQPLFCSGLQLLIDAQPDLDYVGAAHSGRAAVEETVRLQPDIVLMDLRMPDGNGVTATREIVRLPRRPASSCSPPSATGRAPSWRSTPGRPGC